MTKARMEDDPRNMPLEGLRAIAVTMVLLTHAGAPFFGSGWLGVDIFFVLSGFLIVTLLLREIERRGRIGLGAFWMRRFLRLMPAYILYCAGVTVLFFWSPPETKHVMADWIPKDVLITIWTYTSNYLPPMGLWDYQHLTIHLWSLAVEEQFYFLLPVFLAGALRAGRAPLLGLGLLGVGLAALFLLGVMPGNPVAVLHGRGLSLVVGGLMATWAQRRGRPSPALAWVHKAAICAAIGLFVTITVLERFSGWRVEDSLLILGLPFWASTAWVVAGYWYGWSGFGHRLLCLPPLGLIGKLSYGLYLYHMVAWLLIFHTPQIHIVSGLGRYPDYGLKLMLYLALAALLAALSHAWIEMPFLRLKRRFQS